MPGEKDIIYKCLYATLILLIISWIYLYTIKNITFKPKDSKLENNKVVKIKTLDDEINVDFNVFEMYINKIRSRLTALNNKFNENDSILIKKYLKKAKLNTGKFISINNKLSISQDQTNDSDLTNDNVKFDYNTKKEKSLLQFKLSKVQSRDDIDLNEHEINQDIISYEILELITDLDTIIFLIKNKLVYATGVLDLSDIERIFNIVDKNKKKSESFSDNKYLKLVKQNSMRDIMPYKKFNSIDSAGIDMYDQQNEDLNYTNMIKEVGKPQRLVKYDKTDLTHTSQNEFDNSVIYKSGKQLTCSNYHKGQLDWHTSDRSYKKENYKSSL
jgi:hypothetical protein